MNYRRAFVPNGYLHIIITSYDRKPIFIENIDILRTAFKNTKTIYEFKIIAICVLPNHIHLILHPNNIEQYSQIISSIKHYFSRNVGQVCPTDRFATCVDRQGKRYNIELDNIRGFEDDFEK